MLWSDAVTLMGMAPSLVCAFCKGEEGIYFAFLEIYCIFIGVRIFSVEEFLCTSYFQAWECLIIAEKTEKEDPFLLLKVFESVFTRIIGKSNVRFYKV